MGDAGPTAESPEGYGFCQTKVKSVFAFLLYTHAHGNKQAHTQTHTRTSFYCTTGVHLVKQPARENAPEQPGCSR